MPFDPEAWSQRVFTHAGSTEYENIPHGFEGPSTIVTAAFAVAGQNDRPVLEVRFRADAHQDKPPARCTFWLDLTPDGEDLDFGPGKNVRLNRLRAILGQNVEGAQWAPGMLVNGRVIARYEQRGEYTNVTNFIGLQQQPTAVAAAPAAAPTAPPTFVPPPQQMPQQPAAQPMPPGMPPQQPMQPAPAMQPAPQQPAPAAAPPAGSPFTPAAAPAAPMPGQIPGAGGGGYPGGNTAA